MASSSRSGYHQDYIARIRYSNALPPPPNPPKLLDIPGSGLTSGQYTSAAFASRLAREQPLNIEADGELGMPIDLIGIPGIFEGDESAISALDDPPPAHPRDKPLLRPLAQLGKSAAVASGVSFLRRTEYISSDQGRSRIESATPRDFARMKQDARKRKRSELERDDDPIRMLRGVYKGFDLAYPEDAYTGPDSELNVRGAEVTLEDRRAWQNPKHPTNPDATPVDFYPLLPDPAEIPEAGTYIAIKFITNPSAASETYDQRLDVGIFRPVEPSPHVRAQYEAARKAYEADPKLPHPGNLAWDYEFFLPTHDTDPETIKGMFDVNQPHKHDASNYDSIHDDTGKKHFEYRRVRTYETQQQNGDPTDIFGDTLALALHDPDDLPAGPDGSKPTSRLQKAAYFYPVHTRASIRPLRPNAPTALAREREKVDKMEVTVAYLEERLAEEEAERAAEEAEKAAAAAAAAAEEEEAKRADGTNEVEDADEEMETSQLEDNGLQDEDAAIRTPAEVSAEA